MKRLRLTRPSPALVIALVALFVALGGTGYAALKLPKNSVGTKQLKKNAVTGSKIKANAVTSSKVKNGSLTGADINLGALGTVPNATNATNATHASSADSATNASQLGGVAASGYERSLRWAVVSANAGGATVVRGNATDAGRISTGNYFVSFAADIRSCAYVATDGDTGAGAGPPGEISVEQRSSTNATDIEVRHYDSTGAATDFAAGDGFHIVVTC
jgi:hypothetical protein